MNKEKYIQELDHLHINGTFKESMKENLYQETLKTHKKWNMKVVSLCVVSACLLIVFMNGQNASPQHQDMLPDIISTPSIQFDGNKPEIEVPSIFYPYISSGDGFGHAGVMVKDKAELQTHNPYDMNHSSKTMPVYYNWNRVDINGNRVHEVSEENQKAILQNYAKRLQIKDYEIKKEQFRNGYVLKSQYYELAIHYSTTLNIKFSEEYIKMNPIDMTVNTQEEADALTLRLFEMYKNLFDIKEPIVNTSYDYNIYGEKHWTFSISEKKKIKVNH